MAKKSHDFAPIWRFLFGVFFAVYVVILLGLLFNREVQWKEGVSYLKQLKRHVNLDPFFTIGNYWSVVRRWKLDTRFFHCIINLAGNVVLFIPIGGFLPMFWPKFRNFFRFFLTCALSICLVEVTQLLTLRGSLDVDDFILNLFGMLVGYLLYMLFHKKR